MSDGESRKETAIASPGGAPESPEFGLLFLFGVEPEGEEAGYARHYYVTQVAPYPDKKYPPDLKAA